MPTILVASNNAHKLQELREIFDLAGGRNVRLVTPRELGLSLEPDETSDAYFGNARIKAEAFVALVNQKQVTGIDWVMSDDSGIEVDALDGRPGVHSAPYQKAAPNGDGCAALIAELKDVPTGKRTGRFVCVIVLASPRDGTLAVFEGVCPGTIAFARAGQGGFGYDPIFLINPTQTIAELSSTDKHAISHRGLAARQALSFVRTGEPLDMAYVQKVKSRVEAGLLKTPGVVSVGIGRLPALVPGGPRPPAFVAGLKHPVTLPTALGGIPLIGQVTGELRRL
jgi:XTP/dITP diphosphohydrolase